jgi:signal transduction histidine kinase
VPSLKELLTVTRILIIDDDAMVREMIATALEQAGMEPVQAPDGQQGVQVAISTQPDLILCDVQMPRLDGYATLAQLRKNPSTATIPFIFLTGLSDRTNIRQGMDLGADDFLSKPITVLELLGAIHSRLEKRRLTNEHGERKLEALRSSITLSLPHEIRTPLSGIIGFAEVLRDDSADLTPAEISDMAGLILKSANRLGNLTENFLSYAQLEILASDPDRVSLLRTERTAMLDMHIDELARKKQGEAGRGEDIVVNLTGGEAAISNAHMRRVVEELVDNAVKFSAPGTPVHVVTERTGGMFRLSVTDRGIGMSDRQIAEISAYNQFERTTREQQGAGLGLALVKRLIELYGGSVVLRSELGKGTTVTVTLPIPPS